MVSLWDYTEEQLMEECVLTHYEILGLNPYSSSSTDIKKAFRKLSLKYHPDKHNGSDYAFLALKRAHDELYDEDKRQAYDSTKLPFDDSIPASREKLIEEVLYKDEDFYDTFGPVFERNLRFDAKLKNGKQKPPDFGDDETPINEVHSFYEYWIHFDSWRDFTQQATDELQLENELENAESRFEKRWLQKEIQKKAKQYKRKEVSRVQLLVQRAMEVDPRLQREREQQAEAKAQAQRAKQERQRLAEQEKRDQAKKAAIEEKQMEERLAQEKKERQEAKQQLRKARQGLRRSIEFQKDNKYWADSYDMGLDVDLLCQGLDLTALLNLTQEMAQTEDKLGLVHLRAQSLKTEQEQERKSSSAAAVAAAAQSSNAPSSSQSTSTTKPWTKDELSALAKAVKKYPPGGASRWEQIALFVNNLCKQDEPRSRGECIEKYNAIAKKNTAATTTSATTTTTSNTTWTAEQNAQLQQGLATNPASMDKNERWTAIAKGVNGKTKKECVARFKEIRQALQKK